MKIRTRFVLYVLTATVPVLLFLNMWQVYRFVSVERLVSRQEAQQYEWIEINKRLETGIGVLVSPSRIDRIAREELGLMYIPTKPKTFVRIASGHTDG